MLPSKKIFKKKKSHLSLTHFLLTQRMEGEKRERLQKSEKLSLWGNSKKIPETSLHCSYDFLWVYTSKQDVLFQSQKNWSENTLSGYREPNFCWVFILQPAMATEFGLVKIKVLSPYEPSKEMHLKAFIYVTLNFPTTHPSIWSAYSTGGNRHGKNYDAMWRLLWSWLWFSR